MVPAGAANDSKRSKNESHRPGAGGNIGTEQVARAQADGHTLLFTSNAHVVNDLLYKQISYRPFEDFKSVALVKTVSPLVMVVSSNSAYRSLADVTAAARARPGKLTFASGNSSSRIGGEMYKQIVKADILHVPYKGIPEALNEVSAGRVDFVLSDSSTFQALLKAGKIRAVASTSAKRMSALPDVPTTAEAGLPEFNIGSWNVMLVPAGTPDAVADRLNALVDAALKTDSAARHFAASNTEPFFGNRAEVDRFMASERKKWAGIIEAAHIEPQ